MVNINKIEFNKLPEKGAVTFSLRMPQHISDEIDEIVKATGITKTSVINQMIAFGLKNYEINE